MCCILSAFGSFAHCFPICATCPVQTKVHMFVYLLCLCAEYSSTLHQVFAGLESSVLPLWQLGGLLLGYLGLLLFTVYLASSEVRLPIVQYSKVPPPVSSSSISRYNSEVCEHAAVWTLPAVTNLVDGSSESMTCRPACWHLMRNVHVYTLWLAAYAACGRVDAMWL